MSTLLRFVLVALLGAAGGFARAELPAAVSGSWFDPAHPGHGLSVEVLDEARAVAYWFVYDADGRPLHLYVDARIGDRTLEGTAYSGRGMRFGGFDPRDHRLLRWGHVAIEFTSCDTARLSYDASGEAGVGFGTGAIALRRLASVAQLACAPNTLPALRTGVYSGSYTDRHGIVRPFHGYVDRDGRLHAAGEIVDAEASTSGSASPVVIAETARYRDGIVVADATVWAAKEPDADPEPVAGHTTVTYRAPGGTPQLTGSFGEETPWRSFNLGYDAARSAATARPLPGGVVPLRRYAMALRAADHETVLEATQELCLYRATLPQQCGNLPTEIRRAIGATPGEFRIRIRMPGDLRPYRYRGVTWIEYEGEVPLRLFAIGDGGYAFVGRLRP